ncbi:MAG: S8 family serine peptidase, partial [Acidimicrobiia bacterium]
MAYVRAGAGAPSDRAPGGVPAGSGFDRGRSRRVRAAVAISTAVMGALGGVQALAEPAGPAGERTGYIVELNAPALAAEAPRPAGGRGLSAARWSASQVAAHDFGIQALETNALAEAAVAPSQVFHRYRSALAGFAAHLTSWDAARLARAPGVARVTPDTIRPLAAVPASGAPAPAASSGGSRVDGDGADYLGLPEGLWSDLGGPDQAGEDLVVGVIDTGIDPDHPSFADRPGQGRQRRYIGPAFGSPPSGWRGSCQEGEGFAAADCNRKLIGARFFVAGFGSDNVHPDDFLSPLDGNGHGSHTASTAAGNYGVDPVVGGHSLGVDLVSGIAPRARVAAYKVCWAGRAEPGREASDGCADTDSVAAVDAAVGDGVDVINFSVGGPTPEMLGPVGRAFLGAVSAGVFVANSAGNEGPEPGTLGAPASVPWITSVAASTLARTFVGEATVRPAPGAEPLAVEGASVTGALDETPLVDAAAVPAGGISPEESELCLLDSLDPSKVAGKVVLCLRGQNGRVEKGLAVKAAGGLGMLLFNALEAQETVADGHVLPTIHLHAGDGEAIKALIAGATDPVVALSAGSAVEDPVRGDILAAFSSRGPQIAVPDIPKPDVTAPGVNILAATTTTPAGEGELEGESFALLSGTSMSSPHVAGAAALLLDRHPGWSPSVVKSALMLTANPDVRQEDGVTAAGPFETGSGRIDPSAAADVGLVLEATSEDYQGYLEGLDPEGTPGSVVPVAPIDLNLPAVSSSQLAGLVSTKR